jgi:hypothetical protein
MTARQKSVPHGPAIFTSYEHAHQTTHPMMVVTPIHQIAHMATMKITLASLFIFEYLYKIIYGVFG